MKHRVISILIALIVFEAQVILLDVLSKAENIPVSLNPLNAISAVAFVLGWTTALNSSMALVTATVALLLIPIGVYCLCHTWLKQRHR
ncbi:hypothetical protein [Hafnia paralvei]|uniref:hypothetical protein n=1 Tax=Hafnia paralvei TaxID=546367 RepID=UPI000BB54BDB|nr:hypothetical protein [Hafnia paralvei]MCE9946900.1 hypothetical protein [Hafnia paralvei]PNK69051.1 hypothetical protein A6J69_019310 [Hafnia paralvei]